MNTPRICSVMQFPVFLSFFQWLFKLIVDFGFLLQGKSIAIFYGSQTGTAEEFAGRLAKDAQRYGLKSLVLDPEECDMVSTSIQQLNMGQNPMDICEMNTGGHTQFKLPLFAAQKPSIINNNLVVTWKQ